MISFSWFPCKAVMFLEHWKRRQNSLNYSWNMTGMEEEEVCLSLTVNLYLYEDNG